jgi:uncharacterized protein
MEKNDKELVEKLMAQDLKLKRLYEQHQKLERKVSSFEHRNYLLPEEEIELKRLKQRKLAGVDSMMAIIADRREAA